MDNLVMQLAKELNKRSAPSNAALTQFKDVIGFHAPDDYMNFLSISNGAEGWIGEQHNSYLMLYSIEQMIETRDTYLKADAPAWLFIFGSDGGGTGYAFDTRSSELAIVEIDWYFEILNEIGHSYLEFLEYLASRSPLE